ncbi:MAG: hypothetical protein CML13_02370 [Puniceicoccaceae bacterium]|nr:hypothetical protein [Puniceicoccaceae bacterium]|tara:strand:- start:6672 stop:8384 length:1713 start_codon:yes stop_codon:yes gene_type:complete
MIFSKKIHKEWGIVDCSKGTLTKVEGEPFIVGNRDGVDLRIDGSPALTGECAFSLQKKGSALAKCDGQLFIDERFIAERELQPDEDYALRIGTNLCYLYGGDSISAWFASMDLNAWWIIDSDSEAVEGPFSLEQAKETAKRMSLGDGRKYRIMPVGTTKAFDIEPVQATEAPKRASQVVNDALSEDALLCPHCWVKFEIGDMMHVAMHDELRGDPIMGEDAAQRFLATNFDDDGNALDPMGLPCMDTACPHCRNALPVNFVSSKYNILSVVGNASAGKSYYLAVMSRILPRVLIGSYGMRMQDADPTANAPLTAMRSRLFGGANADEVALDKTQLGGAMYTEVFRHGKHVSMPRPFSFLVEGDDVDGEAEGLIFYDNAGEHFQPGIELQDSPGALHVAYSSGVLFLFDPLRNHDFRQLLAGHKDPQVEAPMNDIQAVILSEMRTRIAKVYGQAFDRLNRKPFAFILGKLDAWEHLLEGELVPYLSEGKLDKSAVDHNSKMVRDLLMRVCPEAVANAESLTKEIKYFPVSSFGHTPILTESGSIAPVPNKIAPKYVEVPVLWLLQNQFNTI